MTVTFDAAAYKRTTRSQWEEAAEAWHRWGPAIEDWLGRGHRDDARPGRRAPTARGCSTSPPAPAARPCSPRVGWARRGHVLATDISPAILEYAAEHGRRQPAWATSPPASSTASTSTSSRRLRRGDLPGRPDLLPGPAGRPARHARRAAPGRPAVVGRLLDGGPQRVLLGPGRHHPPPGAAAAAAARAAGTVQPGRPRGRRGGPTRTAGFRDVTVDVVESPVRMATAAECVRFEQESFGALHQMLSGLPEDRARGGVGRDRRGAGGVRRSRRVHGPLRDAGGDGDEVGGSAGTGELQACSSPVLLLRV